MKVIKVILIIVYYLLGCTGYSADQYYRHTDPEIAWLNRIRSNARFPDPIRLNIAGNIQSPISLASKQEDSLLIYRAQIGNTEGLYSMRFINEYCANMNPIAITTSTGHHICPVNNSPISLTILNNNYLLVYRGNAGYGEGLFSSSMIDGRTWSDPVPLRAQTQGYHMCPVNNGPISATTLNNQVVIIYRAHDGTSEGLFSSSTIDGRTWSDPVPLRAQTQGYHMCPVNNGPFSTTTLNNRVLLIYRAIGGMIEGLFSSSTSDGQTWSDPVPLIATLQCYHMCPIESGAISLTTLGNNFCLIYQAELGSYRGLFSSLSTCGTNWDEPKYLRTETPDVPFCPNYPTSIALTTFRNEGRVLSFVGAEQDLGGERKYCTPILIFKRSDGLYVCKNSLCKYYIVWWGGSDEFFSNY